MKGQERKERPYFNSTMASIWGGECTGRPVAVLAMSAHLQGPALVVSRVIDTGGHRQSLEAGHSRKKKHQGF